MQKLEAPFRNPTSRRNSLAGSILWVVLAAAFFLVSVLVIQDIGAMICALIALALGLIVASQAITAMRVATMMDDPEIWINTPQIRVGDEFPFIYQQSFKKDLNINFFTITMILREAATYQQGTDTVTVTHEHVAQTIDFPIQSVMAGQIIREQRTLSVPLTAMHSFEADNNKLTWLLRVRIDVIDRLDFQCDYPFVVFP